MPDLRLREPNRRRHGTGSIVMRGSVYYGKWWSPDGRQMMRRLGPVRPRGTRDGLTKTQAEGLLRRMAARKIRVVRTYVGGKEDTPKSESSRRAVPLADRLAGELQRLYEASPFKADDDPVFTHPRGTGLPLDGSAVSKSFKRALARAGVRKVRFHDLRHTFGTMMARDPRVSMRTLQGWLGHADPGTTAIYAHFAPNAYEADWVQEAFAAPAVPVRASQ
jgi:integrase